MFELFVARGLFAFRIQPGPNFALTYVVPGPFRHRCALLEGLRLCRETTRMEGTRPYSLKYNLYHIINIKDSLQIWWPGWPWITARKHLATFYMDVVLSNPLALAS